MIRGTTEENPTKDLSRKVLIVLGPPGAGKGTQSRKMANFLHIPHISTGDILRESVDLHTEIGRQLYATLRTGGLVPDALVLRLLIERFDRPDCGSGFVLDGFPRTIVQARALQDHLSRSARVSTDVTVIHFVLDTLSVFKRLVGRRVCPACNSSYNIYYQAPIDIGKCDLDGALLRTRFDDNLETVRKRVQEYKREIESITAFYSSLYKICEIDANQPMHEVTVQVIRLIGVSTPMIIRTWTAHG